MSTSITAADAPKYATLPTWQALSGMSRTGLFNAQYMTRIARMARIIARQFGWPVALPHQECSRVLTCCLT
jgi:hypothetical protein